MTNALAMITSRWMKPIRYYVYKGRWFQIARQSEGKLLVFLMKAGQLPGRDPAVEVIHGVIEIRGVGPLNSTVVRDTTTHDAVSKGEVQDTIETWADTLLDGEVDATKESVGVMVDMVCNALINRHSQTTEVGVMMDDWFFQLSDTPRAEDGEKQSGSEPHSPVAQG